MSSSTTRIQIQDSESTYFFTSLEYYCCKTESEKKPFFAYLAFQVAHSPFQAPLELVE